MTYTIIETDFDQNDDQTIEDITFRLENNEEPFDRFNITLTWRTYCKYTESELKNLFQERIRHQTVALGQMAQLDQLYLKKEIASVSKQNTAQEAKEA